MKKILMTIAIIFVMFTATAQAEEFKIENIIISSVIKCEEGYQYLHILTKTNIYHFTVIQMFERQTPKHDNYLTSSPPQPIECKKQKGV